MLFTLKQMILFFIGFLTAYAFVIFIYLMVKERNKKLEEIEKKRKYDKKFGIKS